MLDADGYLFGTTANFGYMSGALKHFFDTVYYPSLDHVSGRPYGLWVHGNNDTVGAAAAVGKLATGLSLTQAADVLEVVGAVDAAVRERAYELGGTLAATLMERWRSRGGGNRDVQCGAAAGRAGNPHVPAEGFHSVDQAHEPRSFAAVGSADAVVAN